MGHKNAVTKRFCGDKIRFADLVNGLYFQGQQVVLPEELSEAGEVYAVPNDISTDEKHREYLVNEDCLEFLSVIMDSPRLWKDREKYMSKDTSENNQKEMEGYDVCQAIRELIEDGRQEGRLEGKKEGRMEALKLSVENLMKSLSISLDKACELLDINEECDKLKQMID